MLTLKLFISFKVWILFGRFALVIALDPQEVKNDKDGQLFNDAVLKTLAKSLAVLGYGNQETWKPNMAKDVATIEAIEGVEEALSQTAMFFARYLKEVKLQHYVTGVAMEFITVRCDSIISNKFPIDASKVAVPWIHYRDSVYYGTKCPEKEHVDLKRKRREIAAAAPLEKDFSNTYNTRSRRNTEPENAPYCGNHSVLNSLTGELASPFYPERNYSSGMSCIWRIQVPIKYAVAVYLKDFSMEFDKFCLYDYLEFHDGVTTTAPVIRRICGSENPGLIRSSGHVMTIAFHTDQTMNFRGFRLIWNLTFPILPHPGFLMFSNIVIDQLEPDESRISKIRFNTPTTCGLSSNDVFCYFQTPGLIISRIISTRVYTTEVIISNPIEVIFEHIIEKSWFPRLYLTQRYCVTWSHSVRDMPYGSWTRRGGKVYESFMLSTTCHFDGPGIHALIALVPRDLTIIQTFQFTLSWYTGIVFAILWLVLLLYQMTSKSYMHLPDWLNTNQIIAIICFLGVTLSGMQLHFAQNKCALMSFLLYYFGLSVFVWHFLKGAQLTGKFDDVFAKGRNVYVFYFILGWTVPFFIAGMAGGSKFFEREPTQSCWLALYGGTVWGYTAPSYFLVMANALLLYKKWKKNEVNVKSFNHSELRKRIYKDIAQLFFFTGTWATGVLCVVNKESFWIQYAFSLFAMLMVVTLSLTVKQRRPGFQKEFDDYMPPQKTYRDMAAKLNSIIPREDVPHPYPNESISEYQKRVTTLVMATWSAKAEKARELLEIAKQTTKENQQKEATDSEEEEEDVEEDEEDIDHEMDAYTG